MIVFLSLSHVRRHRSALFPLVAGVSALVVSLGSVAQPQNAYTVFTAEGRRTLAAQPRGGTDMVSLDQVVSLFGLTVAEDPAVGLTISGRAGRILALSGQSFVQVAGRVESLSAPVQRDRGGWQVPIDFVSKAVGPAVGMRIEVRRAARLILVGDVRVPQITTRFERVGADGRLIIDVLPGTPHRVTREGDRLVVRFDAPAIDARGVSGLAGDFVANPRVDGTSLIFDLGPSATTFRAETERDQTRLTIELSPLPPAPTPPPQEPAAPIELPSPGVIRTVVIDPGHGGNDVGARGARGTQEKDFTLQMARRLKAAIESRMGLRVLLTRDSDDNVPVDRRTALANNNKADLFLSLHANAAAERGVRGAQVLSLALEDYRSRLGASAGRGVPVPMLGGGVRVIEAVPWDVAQIPYADRSAALASILVRHLAERSVPLHSRQIAQLPLRVLVGANMPAILIEMGFLTNADDERALTGDERSNALIEAIAATVAEVRRGALGQTTETAR